MATPPYAIQRTRIEVALCIGILAVALHKWSRLPTGGHDKPRAVFLHRRMLMCQRMAAWFGQQAIRAEDDYWREVQP